MAVWGGGGGEECTDFSPDGGPQGEAKVCNPQSCPVDCQLASEWEVGPCSKSCGGGVKVLRRGVVVPGQFGGEECPDADHEDRLMEVECNLSPCGVAAAPCVLDNWSEWSACDSDCGVGE